MKKYFVLILPFLWSLNVLAQTKIPMDTAIRYGKLSNGLTYYIRHNEYPPQRADFYIVQNVGAILEEDNQNGLAHFLEHMAFNGTKNFPDKAIINYMETIGVKFGANINAYTSLDETVYLLKNVPTIRPSIVDSSLLVLHDWSSFITLDGSEIDKERGVIREEWRTGATADRRMWKESNKLKYPNSQYAKRDVIGDTAIINNFKYDELRAYYKKWYRPDLQALIIVGDVDVNQVEATIKRQFADIPAPINPAKRIIYDIPDNKEPIVAITTDPEAKVATIEIDYKHTPRPDSVRLSEKGYTTELIDNLIAIMLNDRFNKLRNEKNCPYIDGGGYYDDLTRSRDAFVIAVVSKEGLEKQSLEALLKEAQRMKQYGFSQTELDRAKANLLANYEKSYNERDKRKNNSYVGEYTRNFLEAEPIPSMEWEYSYAKKAIAGEITLEAVNKVAQSYVTPENMIVDISAPQKPTVKIPTGTEIRELIQASEHNPVEPYKVEKIEKPLLDKKPKSGSIVKETKNEQFGTTEWTLDNGVRVILKPTAFKNDEISMYAFSEGGYSLVKNVSDLPSAQLADEIVVRGEIGKLNQYERSLALTGKMAGISTNISEFEETMSGATSVKDAETMFQLAFLRFTHVRKNAKSYETFMQSLRTKYANQAKNPNAAFNDTLSLVQANYNPRRVIMNLQTLDQISSSKAYSIYKERFKNPADFTFVLVGNITMDSIKPLITTYLGGLKTDAKRESWVDNNIRYPKGKIDKEWTRDMQVEKSSVCLIYTGGMIYNFENSITAGVLASILDLRYTESIREDEGGTYGVSVSTRLTNRPQEQIRLAIRFDTDPQKAGKLIGIAQKELDNIRANGVRTEDLEKVKKNLFKNFAEGQKENSWWQSSIAAYEKEGFNYLSDYERIVTGITSEKLQQMLEAIVSQSNCIKFVMNPK